MNRIEFVGELKKRLRNLPFDEIKEAVDYYEEYFDEAGAENEQTALDELGSPSAIAAQIIASSAVKEDDSEKSAKKSWRSAWLVILALFASPIAVPLAVAVGAVAFALAVSLAAVLFSFFAAGVAMLAGGVAYIIFAILIIAQSVSTTLLLLGLGLVLLGLGGAVFIGTMALSKKCFNWLAKWVSRFILRRKSK